MVFHQVNIGTRMNRALSGFSVCPSVRHSAFTEKQFNLQTSIFSLHRATEEISAFFVQQYLVTENVILLNHKFIPIK